MHGEGFFFQAFVYLAAAVISVPIAKRLGLGSVLGYLLAGVAIGPFALGFIGEEGQDVMHFAEFGVVIMLFLVGLELEPSLLWRMKVPVLGLGGLQVLATALLIMAVALVAGLRWQEALAIGMTLALSSTAIVLQTLQEKGLMKSAAGQSSFAVLLFQDIAVIPMLALFPLLATGVATGEGDDGHHATWVDGLPGWAQTLVVLGAVAGLVIGGHYAIKPSFRLIARTRMREVFVAAALLLVIGIALLMSQVGLSPALGTFVAGVVLANSEYRHELESDIEPFKGLLLGLFFIAVGASIDFRLISGNPGLIAGLVVALIAGKFIVLLVLSRIFRLGTDQGLLFSFALAQGGEFAFVLFSFAEQSQVLTSERTAPLVAAVAVTMALTPLLMLCFEKLIQPRVGTKKSDKRAFDAVHGDAEVIIAGFGRVGQIAGRLLTTQGIPTTVLEYDSDQVDLLRKFGRKVFYGDASRYDLLASAGANDAKVLILAIDRPEKTLELVHTVKKHFPNLKIIARATGRVAAYDLLDAGVEHVYRETFDSALRMGVAALEALGHRRYRAQRAALLFRRQDEALVRELASRRKDDDFIDIARARGAEEEKILRRDFERENPMNEEGWDTDSLAEDFGDRADSTSGVDN
ncbi:MAG: monovalent cation:proton antiporter-2 (CPA2) family protein [Myxococcota bacterium]